MGCSHCMENSTKKGAHMEIDVLNKCLEFAKVTGTNSVQISGGEPTSHPKFEEYLKLIKSELGSNVNITLLSNGEAFANDKEIRDIVLDFISDINCFFQITVDPKYYPEVRANAIIDKLKGIMPTIDTKYINSIEIVTHIQNGIIPVGRAKNNPKLEQYYAVRQATSCFNLYSILYHINNLAAAVQYVKLKSTTSLCKPLITEVGDVKFGEYDECTTIVNLMDYEDVSNIVLDTLTIDPPCRTCVNNPEQHSVLDEHIVESYKK